MNTLLLAALTIAAPVALAIGLREAWRQYRQTFPSARGDRVLVGVDVGRRDRDATTLIVFDESHRWTEDEFARRVEQLANRHGWHVHRNGSGR